MTAFRETMTGGNRVMRSLLDGSLQVAMIFLRTTISHQTFRESFSLESDESWSWSQLRLVMDRNGRATIGPGSDRSLILVATVLLCDGLEMTEQSRCYDFEAEYRTEPMSLNERTGDVGANTNQTATGIYSGEQSESNLKHKYSEDNIFAYADASMKSHECKAVWLAFIFVILVLVILSEPLFRFGVGLTTSKIPQPRAGLPPLPNRSGSTLEPILAGNISTQPSCKK
jgi:hypothetical protein